MWETIDPDGRRVVLAAERWLHILEDHEELAEELDGILRGLSTPRFGAAGAGRTRSGSTGPAPGPARFVKVVVHYEGGEGRIVTAFPRRAFP